MSTPLPPPEISVVISTRNRAQLLEACLTSLLQQTVAPERYEICVVNNASTDDTVRTVETLAARFPQHRLAIIYEATLGLTPARNCGLAHVTAPLVAFGDDDATVPPDWLHRYLVRFGELPLDVVKVGGEVDPEWATPRPPWLTEAMLCLLSAHSSIRSDVARFCQSGEVLVECNCCYRRDPLLRMGGFPMALGRKGDNLLSGDNAVDYRLIASGGKFFYDPDIIVRHLIHANRLNVEWFRRRYFWQGVTDFAVRSYLEQHGVTIPATHSIGLPLSVVDWERITDGSPTNLDDVLRQIRGVGFMMAMIGVLGTS